MCKGKFEFFINVLKKILVKIVIYIFLYVKFQKEEFILR